MLILSFFFFAGIQSGINEYREKHLRLITAICKNNSIILEDNNAHSIEKALKQISIKKLHEYGLTDDLIEHYETEVREYCYTEFYENP